LILNQKTYLLLGLVSFLFKAEGQVTITSTPAFANNEIKLCLSSSNQVNYSASYSGSNVTYSWDLPGSTVGSFNGSGPFNATYNNAGNFNSKVVVSVNGVKQDSTIFTVKVSNLQPPVFNPSQTSFCINDSPFILNGFSPSGGTFSGPGVTGNIFNPTTAGIGNHTITYSYTDGICVRNSSVNLSVHGLPSINLSSNGTTTTFNGEQVYSVCTPNQNNTFFFLNQSSGYTSYTINFGDGSAIQNGGIQTNISHLYTSPGLYSVTLTLTNSNGCSKSESIKVFYGTNPGGQINSTGNTTLFCLDPNTFTLNFPISQTQNNPGGTIYRVFFSDDSTTLTFTHPPPASISHTYLRTSCGDSSLAYKNSFYVRFTAENPCGQSSPTIDPINISSPPIADFEIPKDTCFFDSVILIKESFPGTNVSYSGSVFNSSLNQFGDYLCDSATKEVWEITPSTYSVLSGALGFRNIKVDPNSWNPLASDTVAVRFNRPGNYNVKLIVSGSSACGIDSLTKTICIDTIPSAKFALSDTAVCAGDPTDLYYLNPIVPYCDSTKLTWTILPPLGWSLNSGSLTDSSLNVSFNNTGSYEVALKAENPCGISYDTVTVLVVGQPTLSLPPDTTLCGLITLDLSNPTSGYFYDDSSGTSSFTWTVTPDTGWSYLGGSDSTSNYPIFDFQSYGAYTINVLYSNSCFNRTGAININVNKPPQLLRPSDTLLCYNSNYIQSFEALFGSKPLSYSWRVGQSGPLNLDSIISLNNLIDSTIIWVYVEDATNCRDSSSFMLNIPDEIRSLLTGNRPVCYNENVQISTSTSGGIAPYSYTWVGGDTSKLNNSNISNPILDSAGIPGTYILRTTDSWGCEGFDTISFQQHPITNVDAGSNVTICNTLNTFQIGSASPLGGSWTGNNVTPNGSFDAVSAGLGSHTIYYNYTDVNSCNYTDSLVITVIAPPIANFTISDSAGCGPLSILINSTSDPNVPHEWFLNDSLISTSLNFSITLNDRGNPTQNSLYSLKLRVSGSGANCEDSLTKTITLYPKPQANFILPPSACANETINLRHNSSATALDSIRWIASSPLISMADSSARPTDFTVPDNQSGTA
jgi:PKD repeat protein